MKNNSHIFFCGQVLRKDPDPILEPDPSNINSDLHSSAMLKTKELSGIGIHKCSRP